MRVKDFLVMGAAAFLVIFCAQLSAIYMFTKTSNVSKFNLSSDQIVKDLDGKMVSLMMNQVWPFDPSQNISVQVLNKKQMDEYVVVIVDVKAVAAVQPLDDTTHKEQFSTNPNSKEPIKATVKLPSKLQLGGKMKLTYELIDNEWYLLSLDNLNLKAIPLN